MTDWNLYRAQFSALDLPHARKVAEILNAHDILVDYRPHAGIRISPHFCNTPDEIDRVIAQIERLQAEGSWRRRSASRSGGRPS